MEEEVAIETKTFAAGEKLTFRDIDENKIIEENKNKKRLPFFVRS